MTAEISIPIRNPKSKSIILANQVVALHYCTHDISIVVTKTLRGGAEIDLLLVWPDGSLWAVEVKRSLSPRLERGFYAACADLTPAKKFVVYPGAERYRLASDIEALSLAALAADVAKYSV